MEKEPRRKDGLSLPGEEADSRFVRRKGKKKRRRLFLSSAIGSSGREKNARSKNLKRHHEGKRPYGCGRVATARLILGGKEDIFIKKEGPRHSPRKGKRTLLRGFRKEEGLNKKRKKHLLFPEKKKLVTRRKKDFSRRGGKKSFCFLPPRLPAGCLVFFTSAEKRGKLSWVIHDLLPFGGGCESAPKKGTERSRSSSEKKKREGAEEKTHT